MLYVINLIIPLLFFLVLDLVSFSISEARGEKLSFKVTILLSIAVMLLILQDILPSTEANVPMICELLHRTQTLNSTHFRYWNLLNVVYGSCPVKNHPVENESYNISLHHSETMIHVMYGYFHSRKRQQLSGGLTIFGLNTIS